MANGDAWRRGRVGIEVNGSILGDLWCLMSVRDLRADVWQAAGHMSLELSETLLGEKRWIFKTCFVKE